MDATTFTLRREEIQQRMEDCRQASIAYRQAHPHRILSWVASTGMNLVTGASANSKSLGWLGSVAGAFLIPVVMKWSRPKNGESSGVLHRLLKVVFPAV